MKPYGGFEANAQNVRIITRLESKSEKYKGLNLTRAVIDGQLKYKHPFAEDREKFVYTDDLPTVEWAGDSVCPDTLSDSIPTSFECQIMDWADRIAYAVHDLEDGIHAGYIDLRTVADEALHRGLVKAVSKKMKISYSDADAAWVDLLADFRKYGPGFPPFAPSVDSHGQKAKRKLLTSHLIGKYIKNTQRSGEGLSAPNPKSQRYAYSVQIPSSLDTEVSLIIEMIKSYVINSPQVRILERKGQHIIKCLFSAYMEENSSIEMLPPDWKHYLGNKSDADRARVVCDYIAGMTDSYAQKMYASLFLPNAGSIYDLL